MDAVLARYLPEFAEAPPPAGPAGGPDFAADWFRAAPRIGLAKPAPAPAPAPAVPVEAPAAAPEPEAFVPLGLTPAPLRPAEDREALIAAAEARGREAGRAEAMAEMDERIARERTASEERLAGARRDWAEAEGAALAAGLTAAFAALDATLSERVARLLAPVLTDALRRQAVEALSAAVARLLAEPQPAAVSITGPEDLIAALSGRLGGLSAAVAFTAAAVPEVTVSAGETVIETELLAWSRLVAAAVEA